MTNLYVVSYTWAVPVGRSSADTPIESPAEGITGDACRYVTDPGKNCPAQPRVTTVDPLTSAVEVATFSGVVTLPRRRGELSLPPQPTAGPYDSNPPGWRHR